MAGETFSYMQFTFKSMVSPSPTNTALPVNISKYYHWHIWFMEGHDWFLIFVAQQRKRQESIYNKEYLKSAPQCFSFQEMEMETLIPNLPQKLMMEKYPIEICFRHAVRAGALLSHNDVIQQSSFQTLKVIVFFPAII